MRSSFSAARRRSSRDGSLFPGGPRSLASRLRKHDILIPNRRSYDHPISPPLDWPIRQQRSDLIRSVQTCPQTAPLPILGALNDCSAQRISFHVSDHDQQMCVALHREGLESPLPYVPVGAMMAMISSHVTGQQPLHPRAQVGMLAVEFGRGKAGGVHRLEARCAVKNGRGNGALRKIGAVQEGVLRKSFLRNGEYLDQVMYGVIEDDWRASRTPVRLDRMDIH